MFSFSIVRAVWLDVVFVCPVRARAALRSSAKASIASLFSVHRGLRQAGRALLCSFGPSASSGFDPVRRLVVGTFLS